MYRIISFGVYEINSKASMVCRCAKFRKNIRVKSVLILPEGDIMKVTKNKSLMIPEVFMQ
jgi:hypothetical protein